MICIQTHDEIKDARFASLLGHSHISVLARHLLVPLCNGFHVQVEEGEGAPREAAGPEEVGAQPMQVGGLARRNASPVIIGYFGLAPQRQYLSSNLGMRAADTVSLPWCLAILL